MSSNLQRFLGGSPGSVLVRLVFLSLVVGAFLAFLDITPVELIERLTRTLRVLLGNGFEAVRRLGLWIAYGAMIVIPLWLLSRLLNRGR
jgi:Family of unknown function (DUF6460)